MTPLDTGLLPAAFLAGLLMFLAPCTLPLVPGYIAFIAGIPEKQLQNSNVRRRVLYNAAAFVLGFSVVFVLLGVFAGVLGSLLGPWRDMLGRLAGAVIMFFGLVMLGLVRLPMLTREHRFRIPRFITPGRVESSAFIGVLFALGWSPCIGPILGTILFMAGASATAGQGALLLCVFALGLGLPFLLVAVLIGSVGNLLSRFSRYAQLLSILAGVVLLLVGALIFFGMMGTFTSFAYRLFSDWGYDQLLYRL
jgi:cytochrome c-type biogenesis protein